MNNDLDIGIEEGLRASSDGFLSTVLAIPIIIEDAPL